MYTKVVYFHDYHNANNATDKHIENYTDDLEQEDIGNTYGNAFTNSSERTVYMNNTDDIPLNYPDDWSYNYWPLIIVIMPFVTVGGNLLVIVSINLITKTIY